jgi:hypothetical protein
VGGLIEPIAFGGDVPPVEGLGDASFKVLTVKKPDKNFSLRNWLGAVSSLFLA